MTRKRNTAANKGSARATYSHDYGVQFVNIRLSESDKEALTTWEVSEEDLWKELTRFAENGYKVSVSVDLNNTGGIASLTGKEGCVPEDNAGWCLTARGPDPTAAFICLLYKMQAYCHDDVFPSSDSRPAGGYS